MFLKVWNDLKCFFLVVYIFFSPLLAIEIIFNIHTYIVLFLLKLSYKEGYKGNYLIDIVISLNIGSIIPICTI